MWGQANLDSLSADNIGIIPTRVGTSFGNVIIFVWKRDHPHACGDKYTFKSKELERTGSSPRVWGQAACDLLHYAYAGIIPTRVGTSAVCRSYFTSREDHPHACGDKLSRPTPCRAMRGSSPRVWGQVAKLLCDLGIMRIIPTRVGTRLYCYVLAEQQTDHPHACGDKYLPLGTHIKMTGSSPRVWGQDSILRLSFRLFLIIPTRVGTRQQRHNSRHRRTDHPHACGDKIGGTASGYFNLGSSTRVWGQGRIIFLILL